MKKFAPILSVFVLVAAGGLAAQAAESACAQKIRIKSSFSAFEMSIPLTSSHVQVTPEEMKKGSVVKFSAPMFLCYSDAGNFSGISYVQPPLLGPIPKDPAKYVWDWASQAELRAAGYRVVNLGIGGFHAYRLEGKGQLLSFEDGHAYSVLFGISVNHMYQQQLRRRKAEEKALSGAQKAIPGPSKVRFD